MAEVICAAARVAAAASMSALLISTRSASSITPFLMACRSSPALGSCISTNMSVMPATAVFALADAHGFDDHHVVARRLADQHCLARLLGHAAQRAAARAGADVGPARAPTAVPCASCRPGWSRPTGARRVDGQHRHAVALADQLQAQGFDEGGFADARHAADAQAEGFAGVGQQGGEQRVGARSVVGAGGFEQGDGLGDGAALALGIAVQDGFDEGCFDKLMHDKMRVGGATPLPFALSPPKGLVPMLRQAEHERGWVGQPPPVRTLSPPRGLVPREFDKLSTNGGGWGKPLPRSP